MFRQYDVDGSGFVDYTEFREIWMKVANVRQELLNRGVKIGKYTPTLVLKNKLDKLIEAEERLEEEALAEADRWHKYQNNLRTKTEQLHKARIRSKVGTKPMLIILEGGVQNEDRYKHFVWLLCPLTLLL